MASQYPFRRTISNDFLHVTKEIKATSSYDLDLKCKQQYEKWEEQAYPKRMKLKAEEMTEDAEDTLNGYKEILSDGLKFHPVIWETLYRTDNYKPFSFSQPKPKLSDFEKYIEIPPKTWWENIFIKLRQKRENAEKESERLKEQAGIDYENALNEYEKNRNREYEQYIVQKEKFDKDKTEYNNAIDEKRKLIDMGNEEAVEDYFLDTLESENFPFDFILEFNLKYENLQKELIANISLPDKSAFSDILSYKYVASKKSIDPVRMKEKESSELYDNYIKQIIIRLIYVLFSADTFSNVNLLCINGYVNSIDKSTGQKINPCVLSVSLNKQKFDSIDFSNIDVNCCIRSLNGVYVGSIANLAPIKPIRVLNTEDKRFVEAKSVLNDYEKVNMAEMPWEDFEHLIRELFSKYFSSENSEVKITQASRDGGIDAVAFDPDPIKGGKYIIQAKRYNIVVPVSAVRELYGVVVSEGADKGILVTTSDFGSDSIEFSKSKPISLVNGANLLYLLEKSGYENYKIELKK